MNFYIHTLGCKVNQYESQIIHDNLIQSGFSYSGDKASSDIVIINSCTVTSVSDSKAVKLLHRVRRENPAAIIVLTGCLPQAFPNDPRFRDADIILGNRSRNIIVPAINEYLKKGERIIKVTAHQNDDNFEPMKVSDFNMRTRAFVKIEDGCNRFCSYCIIPYARGRVRSKPIDDLKDELESLVLHGYREVVLIGINLSAYGQEFGLNLSDAIEAACNTKGIERVRLGSLEPERMDKETIKRISKMEKLCPQFHLSLQSGCNETLKRMNRHYSAEEYLEIVSNLRNAFENPSITTDIMVGFPGETDEEFEESLNFAKKVAFAKAHVFPYSRRPGTVADKAPNQISGEIKEERAKIMGDAVKKLREEFLQSQIGKTEQVLFERKKNGVYEGYTKNYTPVFIYSDCDISKQIYDVKLTAVEDGRCTGVIVYS